MRTEFTSRQNEWFSKNGWFSEKNNRDRVYSSLEWRKVVNNEIKCWVFKCEGVYYLDRPNKVYATFSNFEGLVQVLRTL